ncbi:MAG: diaminopimelate decarboxylase [Ruminococcaceae bacterium]|nr:diaminopimelate decarboxylase [Oscillospiraceae bacterium]
MLYKNLSVNNEGHLTIAGVDSVYLAKKYGTPLYVMDEELVRHRCRIQQSAIEKYCAPGSMILFASKALSMKEMYRIAKQENIGVDVVSSGELYTALSVDFPAEKIFFHGSSKTDFDISYGIDNGIGYFIVDNVEELEAISEYAGKKDVTQNILLRLAPGIDPHTFEAVKTGKVDSKFGVAIETGQAMEITEKALNTPNVQLMGFHCHIGSQIFDIEPFCDGADIMLGFMKEVKDKFGFETEILNIGGGLGVKYVEGEPEIDYHQCIVDACKYVNDKCDEKGLRQPILLMEPGRSIVADAGVTLYTVNSTKTIPGYKSYIAVDGGMGDNPRFALYGAKHSALIANKASEPADFHCTLAGRCCESDDVICEDIDIQKAERGDIAAVLTTGAYNYSMASNYNRVCRPPIVMLKGGEDRVVVRRETFDDLTACDL